MKGILWISFALLASTVLLLAFAHAREQGRTEGESQWMR
jgi:hypothetical protein